MRHGEGDLGAYVSVHTVWHRSAIGNREVLRNTPGEGVQKGSVFVVVGSGSRKSRDRVEKQYGLCREPPDL